MRDKPEIRDAVDNIISSGDAYMSNLEISVPEMKVEDIWPEYEKLATRRSRKALDKIKTQSLSYQEVTFESFWDRVKYFLSNKLKICGFNDYAYFNKLSLVNYIGVFISTYDKEQEQKAVFKIFEELDFLTTKGYLKGHLQSAKLSRIHMKDGCAIISYPLLSSDGHEYVQDEINSDSSVYIQEGAKPTNLEDLEE